MNELTLILCFVYFASIFIGLGMSLRNPLPHPRDRPFVLINELHPYPRRTDIYKELSELREMPVPAVNPEVQAWLNMRGMVVTWRPHQSLWSLHKEVNEPFIGYLVLIPSYSDIATWRSAMDAYDASRNTARYARQDATGLPQVRCTCGSKFCEECRPFADLSVPSG
jgi:hypothetical protein